MKVRQAGGSKCYITVLNTSDSALPQAVLNATATVSHVENDDDDRSSITYSYTDWSKSLKLGLETGCDNCRKLQKSTGSLPQLTEDYRKPTLTQTPNHNRQPYKTRSQTLNPYRTSY